MVLSSRHFGGTALFPRPATTKPARCCHSAPVLYMGSMFRRKAMVGKFKLEAIPHNFKCRYGERGAAAAKQKAQRILCAAKVSAAGGGYSEPKQGQRSQSARGFCPRSTMRVPQPDILEHFCNADGAPQPLERCLSRQAEIVRCCLGCFAYQALARAVPRALQASVASPSGAPLAITGSATSRAPAA